MCIRDRVESSGRFEKDEVANALATTLQELEEHWEVEQIYTFKEEK